MIVLLSIVITLFYLIIISLFVYGFDKVVYFHLENIKSKTRFSIVIPFRNEASNLPELLQSLIGLEYPIELYEVIFIDDESQDNSVKIIESFTSSNSINAIIIKNERLTNSPKKDAITKAITIAKNEWIVTTDADCILPKQWLNGLDEFIQKTGVKCIVAPVIYKAKNSLLEKFQLLNILSLQITTVGGFGINKPFLCNGANFTYIKELFIELDGFNGNTDIASGDDIFFMEKALKHHKDNVKYLKCHETIVITKPQVTWPDLISQNIRWAAKTNAYSNWFGKITGFIVLLMNALTVTLLIFVLLKIMSLKTFISFLIIKFSIDFILIYKASVLFNEKRILNSYPIAFLIYPFFSTYVAFLSIFKGYKWKGRAYKK